MRGRRRFWLLTIATIVAVGCFAAYRLRMPMLLQKATFIAGVSTWEQPGTAGNDIRPYMTCYWLSDRQLLYFRGFAQLLCLRDLKTETDTPFRKVSRWWSEDGSFKKGIEISPDGQWILWEGDYGNGNYHGYYGARRDGTGHFHVTGKGWPQVYFFHWLSDSRHFIETTTAYVEKTGEYKPQRVVMRSVDSPDKTSEPPYDDAVINGDSAYPPTPGERLIVEEPSASQDGWPPRVTVLSEFLLTRTPKRLHRWVIKAPKGEARREMAVSRRGDRIAWIIASEERVTPFAALLHRIYPRFKAVPQTTARLCVSRIDGTQMRTIGVIYLSSLPGDQTGPDTEVYPYELKWLPDNRQLSFIYHEELYRVDAD